MKRGMAGGAPSRLAITMRSCTADDVDALKECGGDLRVHFGTQNILQPQRPLVSRSLRSRLF